MSDVRNKISSILLLLFVVLTAAAQDTIRTRSCRPVLDRQKISVPRSPLRSENGETVNPYIGTRRQLVILVSFSDQSFQEENPELLWNRIFNEENFCEIPFKGSVHDYFLAQSYGQFDLLFDLVYIPLSESRVKYRSTSTDDENSKYLVNDLVDVLATMNIDWASYDWDDDGYVNQLLIIYAGKGQNAGGDSNTIWPHQWWLSLHENSEARTVVGDDGEYLIDCYCCVNELYLKDTYGTFGTICHEYSHCLGLPDFYYGSSTYLDKWDLMDRGNYNEGGFRPCGYSAHERMLMGWLTLKELTAETTVSDMETLSSEPQAYLVRNDAYPQEYYVIENRQQEGWDAALPGSGLLIFHIDYDEQEWKLGMPNTPQNKRYTIFPANNHQQTSYEADWPYPYDKNNCLTDDSDPAAILYHASDDGQGLMSKPITEISINNGLASFEFTVGSPSAIDRPLCSTLQPQTFYTLDGCRVQTPQPGQIYIVRSADGKVMKTVRQYAK